MTTETAVHGALSEVWALLDIHPESVENHSEQWSILAAHSMQRLAESIDLHLSCKTDRPGKLNAEANLSSGA